jgi:aspartate/methionine/tyrosine aminotransferase
MAEYLRDEAGVGLTPGHVFGSKGEGHVRNAYAQSMADLEEGLDRVKRALGKL